MPKAIHYTPWKSINGQKWQNQAVAECGHHPGGSWTGAWEEVTCKACMRTKRWKEDKNG